MKLLDQVKYLNNNPELNQIAQNGYGDVWNLRYLAIDKSNYRKYLMIFFKILNKTT